MEESGIDLNETIPSRPPLVFSLYGSCTFHGSLFLNGRRPFKNVVGFEEMMVSLGSTSIRTHTSDRLNF